MKKTYKKFIADDLIILFIIILLFFAPLINKMFGLLLK